ncbi:MAG: DUF1731 domain-containing protein [Cellvibrionaceae bacterium]|nr:DUF1731 domain-containing protein [Cellvibrionaceae bacterium]
MAQPRIGILGYGDIGSRLLRRSGWPGLALCRRQKPLPPGCGWQRADSGDIASYRDCLAELDALVLTLTPGERSDEGYRRAYVAPLQALVSHCQSMARPPLLLFVSSTAVYAQNRGEWVDENSPTEPSRYNGQRMLEAEQCLAASGLDYCIVRFSGIYGPGRQRLLAKLVEEVEQGVAVSGDGGWGNRIHADDCAAVLQFVIEQTERRKVYLASDREPSQRWMAKQFIAELKGLPFSQPSGLAVSGKRCQPQALLDQGFSFHYPSFREGYKALLNGD